MISKGSRYIKCVICRDSDGESLSLRQPVDATPRYDDRFHTVMEGDRIDLLAYRYLQDARLWWIIADYNDIFFPLELPVGEIIRIPSTEHVNMHIPD